MPPQVSPLMINEGRITFWGLLIWHLVLPGTLAGTHLFMRFAASELSLDY